MQSFSPATLMEPQWFLPFFVFLWVCIAVLLATLGGWAGLAQWYRAVQPLEGQRFRFVSGSMGASAFPVSYGGCLFVTVGEAGFGLSVLFLFRLFSPPLFIPWSAVESVQEKRFLFSRYTAIRLRGRWPTISFRGAAGEEISRVYAQHNKFNAL